MQSATLCGGFLGKPAGLPRNIGRQFHLSSLLFRMKWSKAASRSSQYLLLQLKILEMSRLKRKVRSSHHRKGPKRDWPLKTSAARNGKEPSSEPLDEKVFFGGPKKLIESGRLVL